MDADEIEEAAAQPASASGDAGSYAARSIEEMILADQYAKGVRSASTANPWASLRPCRVVIKNPE